MNSRLLAVLLTMAAVVAVALVVAAPGSLRWQARPGTTCEDLRALADSMDLSSLTDQAVIRARAVQLAAALTSTDDQETPDGVVSEALRQRVLDRLQLTIDDPEATSEDLAQALRPLARPCEVTLPD